MNRLECRVDSCANNCQGNCSLNKIRVDGPSACKCDQTCCMSFEEKSQTAQNSTNACNASPTANVSCKVDSCRHNDGGKCSAECVCVGCCCQGKAEVLSETECCSFEKR